MGHLIIFISLIYGLLLITLYLSYQCNNRELILLNTNAFIFLRKNNIIGKDVTPYILAMVSEITKGESLAANILYTFL